MLFLKFEYLFQSSIHTIFLKIKIIITEINDYASKEWNGLLGKYYYNRWNLFFSEIIRALIKGEDFDYTQY